MCSSSAISKPIALIFILFLVSNFIVVTSHAKSKSESKSAESLIRKACSNDYLPRLEAKLCYDVLRSQPNIVSSTNFLELANATIQSGISNATNTRIHIGKLLANSKADSKGALQECRDSFRWVILSFNSAFSEVKEGIYDAATYDLAIGSTDHIKPCLKNLASGRVKDDLISYGVTVVPIFGFSASQALDSLLSL